MKIISILVDLFLGLRGLVAAEVDKFKKLLTSLVWLLAGIAIVSALVLTAAGFILAGFYHYLLGHFSMPVASLIASVTVLSMAGFLAVLLKWRASARPGH